jgi:WASH complex subunit 7
MDNDSDDEIFEFEGNDYEESTNIQVSEITNDQHYKILKEISNTFFSKLSDSNFFDTNEIWPIPSEMEPIKINLDMQERNIGVFDLVTSDNIHLNKIISVFTILSGEIQNIIGNTSNITNDYDGLYPLIVYGESADDSEKIEDGEAENQISRMLPFFMELIDKITKLLSIAINLINQISAVYSKTSKTYNESFKNILLYKPFEYLSRILGFYLAIDTIVNENENLHTHWKMYAQMFYRCKVDPEKFGFTHDQSKRLEKTIKRIDGSIMSKKLLENCVKNIVKSTGEFTAATNNSTLSSTVNNKEFTSLLVNYFKFKIQKLNSELNSSTETNQKIKLFQLYALYGYYALVYQEKSEKEILKSMWSFQNEIILIPLISHVSFYIDSFMLSYRPAAFEKSSLDPKNPKSKRNDLAAKLIGNFKYLVTNLKLQTATWATRMNSDLFSEKVNENLGKTISGRTRLIINGIILAYNIKNSLVYLLNSALSEKIQLTKEIIPYIISALGYLKIIEAEYQRNISGIASPMGMVIRIICTRMKGILDSVSKKNFASNSNFDNFKSDVFSALKILDKNLYSIPSKLRMNINEICLEILKSKTFLDTSQKDDLQMDLWRLEVLSKFSSEIKQVCDTSFFYWYRDLIPNFLDNLFINNQDFKFIEYFCFAISETDYPLMHVRYLEDNTCLIKKYRESLRNLFEEKIGMRLSREIDNELRMIIHSVLISNLNLPNPAKNQMKDLKKYLAVPPLQIFEKYFNLKEHVEDYLNRTFYDMTTLNINDWKTYQHMRILAKTKYDLNLHDIYLPSQTLEQGLDILLICRNLSKFVDQYNYNLHSQIFIEVTKDSNFLGVIGVQQIMNSLYTHGIGIINTLVNVSYHFLAQRIKIITQFLMDEFIKSSLMLEKRYWLDHKEDLGNRFSYDRAEKLLNDIKNLSKGKDELTLIDKLRNIIAQMGNALGFIRTIRTALMEYNSQNLKFFGDNSLFEQIQKSFKSFDISFMGEAHADNLQENNNNEEPNNNSNYESIKANEQANKNMYLNSNKIFHESFKIFENTMNLLDQNKKNNINYLTLLVSPFENVFSDQVAADIELFYYLIPSVTINYVENLIVAKNKIYSKNIKDAFFCDDGFILGFCYLLKVFKQEHLFDGLQWFQSVIEKFENNEKEFTSNKNKKSSSQNDILQQNMSMKKITTYKNEFELLFFTFNSSMIVFNDY